MKRRIAKNKLKTFLARYFILLMILFLLSTFGILYYLSNSALKRLDTLINVVSEQTVRSMNYVFETMEDTANTLAFNPTIQEALANRRIFAEFPARFMPFIDNVALFSLEGDLLVSLEGYDPRYRLQNFGWFNRLESSMGENIWIPSHIDGGDYNTANKHVISLVKKIRRFTSDLTSLGNPIGYLVINIAEERLYDLLVHFDSSNLSEVLLTDAYNNIISYSDKQQISTLVNHERLINRTSHPLDRIFPSIPRYREYEMRNGWKFISFVNRGEVISDFYNSIGFSLIIILFLAVLSLLIILFLSKQISHPIFFLLRKMDTIERGLFKESTSTQDELKFAEIDMLYDGYYRMIRRIEALLTKNQEAEKRQRLFETSLKQAEFRALQHQINPHFLFNTLDTINWLASMELHEDVIEMVNSLGELMRAKINPKGSFCTVAEELALVETYLRIQTYRFSDKLSYEIVLDEDLKGMYMMSLMLQPLVENAIIHGVEAQEQRCQLTISVQMRDDSLVCEIVDNGPGMSRKTIQDIYDGRVGGIGISNIMHRLELLFGKQARLVISSELGIGTAILIQTPLLTSEPNKGYPQQD